VAKNSFLLLPVILASAFDSAQILDEVPGAAQSDLKTAFVGRALTCACPFTIVDHVPFLWRADLKPLTL